MISPRPWNAASDYRRMRCKAYFDEETSLGCERGKQEDFQGKKKDELNARQERKPPADVDLIRNAEVNKKAGQDGGMVDSRLT